MGRSYPSRPVVGVGAIILDGNRVLLVKRGREPLMGFWSLPGGGVDLGESLAQALRREVREETGLELVAVEQLEVFERIMPDPDGRVRHHYVLIDYLCTAADGEPHAGDDAAEVRWVERDQLDELEITSGTLPVIERAFGKRDLAATVHRSSNAVRP